MHFGSGWGVEQVTNCRVEDKAGRKYGLSSLQMRLTYSFRLCLVRCVVLRPHWWPLGPAAPHRSDFQGCSGCCRCKGNAVNCSSFCTHPQRVCFLLLVVVVVVGFVCFALGNYNVGKVSKTCTFKNPVVGKVSQ